ncbi:glutaminase domain-containing protein, partial [Singulisphaera rosea]
MPRAVDDERPVMAFVFDLGTVAGTPVSRHVVLAYDDLHAITYFGKPLRPYWRRSGAQAADLLRRSEAEYESLRTRCQAFDDELMADLKQAGGEKYAQLAALAYRQCLAANKLVADSNGQPLLFPKENFSNGCIATVDILFPMDPFFLLFSPTLTKASLAPVLSYAASERWKFPFAPHDLGTYPQANGQVYGGGERTEENQMPVEESGDMILLVAALARLEGNADFASAYWPQLSKWAHYLEEKGFDPENQLCTDDFAGHLAHNVNLSAKAILAMGAYGLLCDLRGEKAEAARYHELAKELAGKWAKTADDGDHFRLAFDRSGTWSQKYNLVWDRLLGLDLFPAEVIRKELTFYLKNQDRYGLPLDNRQPYAKLDWTVWTATMADTRAEFEAIVGPLYDFLNDSPDRVPMSDWYWTKDSKHVGFQARSVVGGVFIKLLSDRATWTKWSGRDRA